MTDKKAVTLGQLEITKNYIDRKDAANIKSVDFIEGTIKFYTSADKSGEAVAEIALPDETFLDGSKTELVSDFSWSITKYPKSVDPELDGKSVLVLAVKSGRTVRYSFISLDSVITKLVGGETESASVSVADDVVTLNVKVSEEAGNRVVMKSDGLYVETVDNTPTWTVSTDDEVSAMFSTSGYGAGTIGEKNVGDIVKIKENGVDTNYIVVHKGLPSDMYDVSCDGVWLLRETTLAARAWDGTSFSYENDYENSDIRKWLDEDFLNTIDSKIRAAVKTVKIPFKKGAGNSGNSIQSGANGLSCKTFLLSVYEVGITSSVFPIDGAKLDYFLNGVSGEVAKEKRIAKDANGAATNWWLRSPYTGGASNTLFVHKGGSSNSLDTYYSGGVRPAFILPYDIAVNADGLVMG